MTHIPLKTMAFAAMALLASAHAKAQQFQATHLQKAAAKLHLDSAALSTDSLPATKQLLVGQQKVVVRKDGKGVVEHIGVPLFADEMRQLQPSPIYDYLEYTVLDRLYKVSANTLTHQDLRFEKGALATLAKVSDAADGCSIENVGEKFYRVKWSRGTEPVVVVSFPINYELLANSNRKEMEENFIRDVKRHTDIPPLKAKDFSTKLASTSDPNIFVVPGNHYIIPEINDNRYLTVTTKSGDKGNTHHMGLLFDRHSPQESLANLMVEDAMPIDSAWIELEFVLDSYKRDTVTMPLRQWTTFCLKQGCQPYFGFETNEQGMLTGTLVMCNKKAGYDHIVAVRAKEGELFSDHPLVHAKVHLFTPSSNVRNLFSTPTKPNRPRIKYSR